jgi:hypothetical protein
MDRDFDETPQNPIKGSCVECYGVIWRPAGSGEDGSGWAVEADLMSRSQIVVVAYGVEIAPAKGHYANGIGQQHGEPGMHVGVVMIGSCRQLGRLIRISCRSLMRMIISMFVVVVTEMNGVILRLLQRVADAGNGRVSNVQRKQGGKEEAQ